MKLNRCVRETAFTIALVMSLCACGSPEPVQETTAATQEKIPVIVTHGDYDEPPVVDYSLTGLPEFVGSIEECTDPDRQYVLPDGCIYAYEKGIVPSAVNQLRLATDIDGTVFNGCGYRNGARIRGILEIGETDYSFVTGFIPVKPGDVIYFSGNCFSPQHENASVMNHAFYDEEKRVVGQVSMQEAEACFEVLETNDDGFLVSMRVDPEAVPENTAYVRLTLLGSGDNQIVSVNEPLDEGEEGFLWVKGEEYVSSAWYDEIVNTVNTVNSIDLPDPSTAVSFIFASDIHLDPDVTADYITPSYTENLGKVCAEVMRVCQIPFFVTGGDNSTQSSGFMPTVFMQNMLDLLEQLSPIPQKNILLALGNHDGATGSREVNGETIYYCYQLNNEERSAVYFDWQRASNAYKRFDSDGTYYYLDDSATKTRYIILNSFWAQWEGDQDGLVSDTQHSLGHNPHFGPQQMKWFAQEALDMPPEYGAVIVAHFAPDAKDFEIFKGIVDAFSGKTTYEGVYTGAEPWQSTEIAVNYKYADGEIIAVFQGHKHEDAEYDIFAHVPCINVTTTGAYWAVKGDDPVKRIKGTASEFAVDVVRIDRVNRIIYLTRLGAGEDRVIPY